MILEIISSIRLGITTGQMGHKNWVRAAGAGARRAPGAALGLAQPAGNILRAENINIETILVISTMSAAGDLLVTSDILIEHNVGSR